MFSSGCAKDSPVVVGKPRACLYWKKFVVPLLDPCRCSEEPRKSRSQVTALFEATKKQTGVTQKAKKQKKRKISPCSLFCTVRSPISAAKLLQVNILTFTSCCHPTSPSGCLSSHVQNPMT